MENNKPLEKEKQTPFLKRVSNLEKEVKILSKEMELLRKAFRK